MKPKLYVSVGAITTVAALISLWVALHNRTDHGVKGILLGLWAVLPPLYFFLELHYIRAFHPALLGSVKESQEAAARIWAGVATALGFIFLEGKVG